MLPLEKRARLEVVRAQLVQAAALVRVRDGEELELGAQLRGKGVLKGQLSSGRGGMKRERPLEQRRGGRTCELRSLMRGRISWLKNWRCPCEAARQCQRGAPAAERGKGRRGEETHPALPDGMLRPLEPSEPLVLPHVHERIDVADDDLPAARQARVELARLVDAAVVALDEFLVLLDVLRKDLVPWSRKRMVGRGGREDERGRGGREE